MNRTLDQCEDSTRNKTQSEHSKSQNYWHFNNDKTLCQMDPTTIR